MDSKRQRCVYVTARQKKKLIELISKNPELISCKVKEGFTIQDSQRLWQSISAECNAIAGARKSWRQWRKTWQDLRSKSKKRNTDREMPSVNLTPAEQDVLGLKASPPNESPQQQTEFVQLDDGLLQDQSYPLDDYASMSEPESTCETKVFDRKKIKNNSKLKNSKHSDCYFNCDVLSTMEQKKLKVKEDYLKFKKEYLRQKLKLIKEQTEALKSIARELAK